MGEFAEAGEGAAFVGLKGDGGFGNEVADVGFADDEVLPSGGREGFGLWVAGFIDYNAGAVWADAGKGPGIEDVGIGAEVAKLVARATGDLEEVVPAVEVGRVGGLPSGLVCRAHFEGVRLGRAIGVEEGDLGRGDTGSEEAEGSLARFYGGAEGQGGTEL